MTVFVTADHHFGHSSIIKLCKRPFDNVTHMDEEMVQRWNSVVGKDDFVYHLGDFSFRSGHRDYALSLFDRLNGTKLLLAGNHDGTATRHLPWNQQRFGIHTEDMHGKKIVMCHYPLEEWEGFHRGAIHLHGHTHGTLRVIDRRYDVGVDVNDFTPVNIEKYLGL